MIDDGVTVKLPTPVWMDKNGNVVSDGNDAMGYKVKTKLTRPDLCIVVNETGCNLSQKGDGNVGRINTWLVRTTR